MVFNIILSYLLMMKQLTEREVQWLEAFTKKHEFFKPILESYRMNACLTNTQYYWLNLFIQISQNEDLKVSINYFKQVIIKIPCPHCSFLCTPQIKHCPKCGEPLPKINEISKIIGVSDSNISEIDFAEKNIIHSLEQQISKPIPLKDKFDVSSICYVKENEEIVGLSLSNCGLNYFPSEILKLTSLKHLALRRNNIVSLLKDIGFLSDLVYLNLRLNKLAKLPTSIGLLSNLKYLNLSSNDLRELPTSIGNLGSLKTLNLSNNKLKNVPECIENLNCLESLNLKANYWICIPESIEKLKKQGLQIYV